MKAWRFKVKSSPKEISEQLKSELQSIGGFVLNMDRANTQAVNFKIRKRFLYIWFMAFQNWTVVKGEMLNNAAENETEINIRFNQHFFIQLVIFTHVILVGGLLAVIISEIDVHNTLYVLLGLLIISGIVLGFAIQRKFEKDIQKYKSLMSEIFEI